MVSKTSVHVPLVSKIDFCINLLYGLPHIVLNNYKICKYCCMLVTDTNLSVWHDLHRCLLSTGSNTRYFLSPSKLFITKTIFRVSNLPEIDWVAPTFALEPSPSGEDHKPRFRKISQTKFLDFKTLSFKYSILNFFHKKEEYCHQIQTGQTRCNTAIEFIISNFVLLLGWQKPKQWVIQTWRLGNSQQIHEWYSFYCRLKSEGFRMLQFSPYPTPRCCNLSRLISRQYKLWGWGKPR